MELGGSMLGGEWSGGKEGVMKAEDEDIRIEIDQARARLESGDAVAVDVVQPGAWEQIDGAVEGAVRIPPDEIEHRFGELPLDLEIITYCT